MAQEILQQFRRALLSVPAVGEIRRVLARLGSPPDPPLQLLADGERVAYMMRYAEVLNKYGFILGGGFTINYLVLPDISEPPRFTFDVYTTPPTPTTKRSVLERVVEINRRLLEEGFAISLSVGRYLYFGLLEHDVEKDVFPFLLPLRVPILTRWSGVALWTYTRQMGVELGYSLIAEIKKMSVEILGVDTPRVDFLRIGVSVELSPPVEQYGAFKISSIAWQVAEKARHKIIVPLRQNRADHDVLKAVLDMRAMWAVEKALIYRYFDEALRRELVELLPQAAEAASRYWSSHHYALVRRKYNSVSDVVDKIVKYIKSL